MDGFGEGSQSNHFDQTFGNKSPLHSIGSNSFSTIESKQNVYGGTDLTSNGQTVASTRQSVIQDGHDTYVNGKTVSSTSAGLTGETVIHNSTGQEIGEIRDGLYGNSKELYINQEHFATTEVDVSGNHKIMLLEDPLTKAHEFALLELILSNR